MNTKKIVIMATLLASWAYPEKMEKSKDEVVQTPAPEPSKEAKPKTESAPAPQVIHKVSDFDQVPADAKLLDSIAATVYAQEGTRIITTSELERRKLTGEEQSLDDLVYEQLMLLDAQKFKMEPDEEQIDKHLASVQRDNNLTLDQLKTIFTNAGYSYEEGRQQFGTISLINQLLDFKIRSRLIVPEKEVTAYFNANPEQLDMAFLVQRALVPFDNAQTHAEQQTDIERFVHGQNGTGSVTIEWQEPFWIERNEMADNKKFIMDMKPDEVSNPVETTEGFELFKLKEIRPERVKTLDERYKEIADALRRPKYEQLLNDYKKQLMDGASVVYFN